MKATAAQGLACLSVGEIDVELLSTLLYKETAVAIGPTQTHGQFAVTQTGGGRV